jgi:AcrR family transcriptional regulator
MDELLKYLRIRVPEGTYLKDPEGTPLGRSILREGLRMLANEGLEAFTFKKLAAYLETSESSIYRYFESKHKLLLYLISLYWGNMEYLLTLIDRNPLPAREKVQQAIGVISTPATSSGAFSFLDAQALHRLIVEESFKTYLHRRVDADNKEGLFAGYKMACHKLGQILTAHLPNYPYTRSLASTLMESALHQQYYAKHLPGLTDTPQENLLADFLTGLALQQSPYLTQHG